MQWDGKIGPSFIVVLALAFLTGLDWLTESKAKISERVAVIETQVKLITGTVGRLEFKMDNQAAKVIPAPYVR